MQVHLLWMVKLRAVIYIKSLDQKAHRHTQTACWSLGKQNNQILFWWWIFLFVGFIAIIQDNASNVCWQIHNWIQKYSYENKKKKEKNEMRVLTHFFVDSDWLAYVMLIVPHHCVACHQPHCHWWQFAPAFVSSACFWR